MGHARDHPFDTCILEVADRSGRKAARGLGRNVGAGEALEGIEQADHAIGKQPIEKRCLLPLIDPEFGGVALHAACVDPLRREAHGVAAHEILADIALRSARLFRPQIHCGDSGQRDRHAQRIIDRLDIDVDALAQIAAIAGIIGADAIGRHAEAFKLGAYLVRSARGDYHQIGIARSKLRSGDNLAPLNHLAVALGVVIGERNERVIRRKDAEKVLERAARPENADIHKRILVPSVIRCD